MKLSKRFSSVVLIALALFANAFALGQRSGFQQPADAAQVQRDASAYYQAGEYEKAIEAYKQAIRLSPDSGESYYHLGLSYSSLGKYKEAVRAYSRATELKPGYAAAYHNLGHALCNLDQYEKAIAAFRQSIRYEPDNVEAYFALGKAYFDDGKKGKAIDAFETAIRRSPDNPYAYYRLGLLYFPIGPDARAVEAFTQAITRDPRYADAYFHRAYSYLFLGRGESAANDANTYISLKGWRAERSLDMAIISHFGHLLARQQDAARKVLEDAARQGDKSAWPYPVIEYLQRKISARLLFKAAAGELQQAEARAYIGLVLSLRGEQNSALDHLRWAKGHSEWTSIPFSLAVTEMDRIKANSVTSFKK